MEGTTVRVRKSHLAAAKAAFPEASEVPHKGRWNGGCSDPGCCVQHPGVTPDGEGVVSLFIPGVSGQEFHRWVLATFPARAETKAC